MRTSSLGFLLPSSAMLIALAGCGGPVDDPLGGCTRVLRAASDGQVSVQTALIEARTGEIVCFDGGTFRFTDELSLSVAGVTLRGVPGAVLDFSTQISGGNGLSITGDGAVIEGLAVRNTPGDGIRSTGVRGITFRRVSVAWDAGSVTANGAYGLYPVGSSRVLIEDSEVVGASDAGIYVGQSSQIVVRRNRARGNVAGIEIENSTDADVYDNDAFDNTGGILVFNLPGLPVLDGRRTLVHHNRVYANNRANFAEPGTIVSNVPRGLGMMILAVDQTEVRDNHVYDNEGTGVMVLSYETLVLFGSPASTDAAYDPFPQGIWVHDNVFERNGTRPRDALNILGSGPIEDILWDGYLPSAVADPMTALCLSANGAAGFRNMNVPEFFANQSTDASVHACTRTPLAPVEL